MSWAVTYLGFHFGGWFEK